MAVYFQGRSTCTIGSTTETPCLPPPLQLSTPYYVVNFARGGTPSNITDADSFQIAATPGGSPIALSSNWLNTATSGVPYDPTGQDFNIVAPPLPATDQQAMYVVGTPSTSRVELAFTPNGSPVTFTQSGIGYNGGGLSAGFYITHDSPIHDITFDGVEIASLDDGEDVTPAYSPFMVNGAIASNYGEHFGINIFRCWIHGHDDQEEFPYYLVDISARSIEVGWSILEGTYSTGNDTQNLGLISTGSIYVHDNELKGATENMFSGGNYPWFANQKNTTGIRVERNFFWKPLKYFHGVIPLYISPTQFTLQPEAWTAPGVGKDCSAASSLSTTNLMYQCYVWETNESSPNYTPAALEVSRHVWDQNPANSTFTVTIGGAAWCPRYIFATQGGGQLGCGFLYSLGGVWHMDYSFTGTVTCPSGWTCTYMAHPSFPVASSRIGLAAMDTGGFQGPNGTFYMQNRHVYQKNNIESKYGDYWSIEGNVFQHQSNCDGGTSCQNEAIHFSIAPNGSGPGDPVNSSVSTSYSMVRNNIIRSIASGVGGTGLTYAVNIGALGGPWEWQGFGRNTQNSVINNLFEDVGSSEFTAFSSDGYLVSGTNVDHWTVSHNTGADVRRFINPNNMTFGTYVSNIATPYRSACGCSPGGGPNPTCVAISGCYYPALTSNVAAQGDIGNGWTPSVGGSWTNSINAGQIDGPPNSVLLNNILMNRSGQVYGTNRDSGWGTVHYPVGTYLIHIMDTMAGTPPTGQLLDPSLLFQTWNERSNVVPPSGLNYRMNNYRLLSGLASTYPSADSRVIGADIDEIEALTGPSGVEIERGRPKFSDRVGRQISAGSTSAVMSYLPNGAACTIEAWSNSAYSGTPAVNIADSGAVLSGGMVSVPLSSLQPGTDYFGKRRCGAEVDVFTFTTTPATPVLALQFNLPPGAAGCQVDYGSSAVLGSSTSAMTAVNGICTVTAPAVPYWQAVYLSPTGGVVSRGTIQHRGL